MSALNGGGNPELVSRVEVYGTQEQKLQARTDWARKISADMDHELGISNAAKEMILQMFQKGQEVRDGDKIFYNWEDFRVHRITEMTRQKTPAEEQRESFNQLLRKSLNKRSAPK